MDPLNKNAKRQRTVVSRNGTCTHITMTRLYTDEFRCVICLKTSSMGWVWRCTQDRDLMLEDKQYFDDVSDSLFGRRRLFY